MSSVFFVMHSGLPPSFLLVVVVGDGLVHPRADFIRFGHNFGQFGEFDTVRCVLERREQWTGFRTYCNRQARKETRYRRRPEG